MVVVPDGGVVADLLEEGRQVIDEIAPPLRRIRLGQVEGPGSIAVLGLVGEDAWHCAGKAGAEPVTQSGGVGLVLVFDESTRHLGR